LLLLLLLLLIHLRHEGQVAGYGIDLLMLMAATTYDVLFKDLGVKSSHAVGILFASSLSHRRLGLPASMYSTEG
jgi:hypothetical protein